jgi:alcohol dehydrogenase
LAAAFSNRWSYSNPVEVMGGPGRLHDLGRAASGRCLIVTTAGATARGLTRRVRDSLRVDGTMVFDGVLPNPSIESVDRAVTSLRAERIDTLVAVGGGSCIDTAKALAALLRRPDIGLRDLLHGSSSPDDGDRPDLIAVPTTAGSGSEVTPFATVWDRTRGAKYSLAGRRTFPRVAVVDPEVTVSLPWTETLSGALDAFCQCLEAIWNRRTTPVATAFGRHGAGLVFAALARVRLDARDVGARGDLMAAATLSGMAISETRTALAHAMSYPLTGHFGVPHGLACGWFVPAVLAFNLEQDDGRLQAAAAALGYSSGRDWVRDIVEWFRRFEVGAAVRRYLPHADALEAVVPEMLAPARADNNMRPATLADVRQILAMTLQWLAPS